MLATRRITLGGVSAYTVTGSARRPGATLSRFGMNQRFASPGPTQTVCPQSLIR